MNQTSPSSSPRSRRRFVRRAVEVPVELIGSEHDEPVLHWVSDLTPFGMWIDTRFPLAVGEQVVLWIEPKAWNLDRIVVFAEVTRRSSVRSSGPTGMGLSFLDLSAEERKAIGGWLRNRPPPLPVEVASSRAA